MITVKKIRVFRDVNTVIGNEFYPVLQILSDGSFYYQYHEKSGYIRKAIKSNQPTSYGNWYLINSKELVIVNE